LHKLSVYILERKIFGKRAFLNRLFLKLLIEFPMSNRRRPLKNKGRWENEVMGFQLNSVLA